MRSVACSVCYLCQSIGEVLYQDLEDRLFDVPGKWTLRKCLGPKCGLIWIDPMPIEEDIGTAYASYHTHHADTAVKPSRFRRILEWLSHLLPSRRAEVAAQALYLSRTEKGRLLDVGCGSGPTLALMAKLGWSVEGIDSDPVAVSRAQERGFKVREGTLDQQQFPDDCFDAVVMRHVIEHLHDPLSQLKECYRVLKPGGVLVTVTPNGKSWGHRRFKRDWRGLEPPRHLHIFSHSSLAAISAKAGFVSHRYYIGSLTRNILLASRSLQFKGEVAPQDPPSVALRIWAELVSLGEWAFFRINPEIAEEVFQISRKGKSMTA
jgi:SAM-dependent methyltransferase